MKMILTTPEELSLLIRNAVKEELAHTSKKPSKEPDSSDLISATEARGIIPYKSKTAWQNLRDSGKIEFVYLSKRCVLYSRQSLLKFLEQNRIKPFNHE